MSAPPAPPAVSYQPDGKVLSDFLEDDSFFRTILGPIGNLSRSGTYT